MVPKLDSGIVAVRQKKIRLGKSMPKDPTRASGVKKPMYSFRNFLFFHKNPDKSWLRQVASRLNQFPSGLQQVRSGVHQVRSGLQQIRSGLHAEIRPKPKYAIWGPKIRLQKLPFGQN